MTDNQIQAAVIYDMLITVVAKIDVYTESIGYLKDLLNARLAQENDRLGLLTQFIDNIRDMND